MRTINVRFLLLFLLCLLVSAGTVHGVHVYQSGRLRDTFLRLAQQALERNDHREAIRHYQKYTMLVTDDAEALADYGLLLSEHGGANPAFFTLERALRLDASRGDLRRALVKVAVKIGRYSDAQTHLQEHLIPQSPQDGELLTILGTCQYAAGEYEASAESLSLAIEHSPDQLGSYRGLINLLRGPLERPGEAMSVLDQLVENNPELAEAYFTRGEYLLNHRAEQEVQSASTVEVAPDASAQDRVQAVVAAASEDAQRALQLSPDNVPALMLSARCLQQGEKFDEARKYLDLALELAPQQPMVYSLLADLAVREEQPQEAIIWLEKGLQAIPDQGDLLWNLANLSVDNQQLDRAKETAARLRATDHPKGTVAFLEARISVAEQQWLAAVQQLESLRPVLTQWPDLAKQAEFQLGACYQQLGKADLQLTAFRRSVTVDPFWLPARLGVAQSLLSLGRIDEAFQEFQYAAHLPGATTQVLLDLARLDILRNLRRNPLQRNWEVAEQILAEVEKKSPDAFVVPILRAEMNVARNNAEQAETILLQARDANPKQVELWTTLIALAQRQSNEEKAQEYLEAAKQEVGDDASLRLAEARLVVLTGKATANDKLRDLAENEEAFEPKERLRLKRGLANLAIAVGDFEHAEQLCRELAKLDPNNLSIHLLLFDLALVGDRTSVLQSALDDIHRIEGNGPLWRYGEAIRMMIRGKEGDSRAWAIADKHLAEARVARPAWSRIPLLMAEIDDVQDDHENAVRHYLEAIELGERNPRAISRVVRLLYEQKRYVEADQVIRRLQEQQSPFSGDMVRMAADISLRLDDFDRAIELAQDAAENSTDYRDHLWLAQVLGVLGKSEEAEAKFQYARELSPEASEVWVAYVGFLARNGQLAKAQEVIAEAEATLPADKKPLTLASCYETLKQLSSAEEQYQAALSSSPNNVQVLRRIANFYLSQGKAETALPYLEKMVSQAADSDPVDLVWSRRNLAIVVGSRGDQKGYERSMSLLDENLKVDSKSIADRRAKAMILASRGESEYRSEAIRLFDQVVQQQSEPLPEDVFLLARLRTAEAEYLRTTQARPSDAAVEWGKARRLMQGLLAANPEEPRYVQAYVDALLRQGENQEAELWLEQLRSIKSDDISYLALQLQVLLANEQHAEALRTLQEGSQKLTDKQGQAPRTILSLAQLLEAGGQRLEQAGKQEEAAEFFGEAENLYAAANDANLDPLISAGFLARRQRFEEAIELAAKAIETSTPETIANFATNISRQGRSVSLGALEKYLQDALTKHVDAPSLLSVLADVHIWQGQDDDAEAVYRRLLKQNPDNVVVLNNLAYLLALREQKLSEAQHLIERAIELAGPRSALLDSRGVILAIAGNHAQAVQDLQKAVAESPSASRLFHLALALERAGNKTAARDILAKAKERGLNAEEFYPLERDLYRKLYASL